MSTKEYLLEATNNGLEFFRFVLPDLKETEGMYGNTKFENTYNPFYHDTKPGLSIYEKNEKWYFHDFGSDEFSGDVFDFASHHYKLNVKSEFYKILLNMAKDLEIELPQSEYNNNFSLLNFSGGYDFKYKGVDDGFIEAHSYFKRYGIPIEVIKEYQVRCIKAYCYYKKEELIKRFADEQKWFAYMSHSFAKMYCPSPKSFFYVGHKSKDYIFGYYQIIKRNTRFIKNTEYEKLRSTLIITGGEKDVLTLSALGYDAICLNSETSSIPKSLVDDLFISYDRVVILYDIDDTGRKAANKLALTNNLIVITLPQELHDKGGKDVSDYIFFDMDREKLDKLINSSQNQSGHGGDIGNVGNVGNVGNENALNSNTADCPFLADTVFTQLPDLLKIITELFKNKRDKDLVLLSTLGVLSTCFPNVKGIYDNKEVGCNLFLFVSAPASAGKGVMEWARRLGCKIQKYLDDKYQKELIKYKADFAAYMSEKNDNPDVAEPVKPKQASLFIPANTSAAKMIEFIDANKDFGIIFETEGDTLSNSINTDWGNFSDTLRKAFHHEPISLARRGNNEHLSVESPYLSVVLSGTPNQVNTLIDSVENGFFSRFIFYDFNRDIKWKNNFSKTGVSYSDIFNTAAEILLNIWQLVGPEGDITCYVQFSNSQVAKFNEYFDAMQSKLYNEYGDFIIANVRRHALIAYRIAMILTSVRHFEQHTDIPQSLVVTDADFNLSISIIDTLKEHLVNVFMRLSHSNDTSKLNNQQRLFYENIPKEGTRSELEVIGETLGIKTKTVEKYIGDLMKYNLLQRVKQGVYVKL